MSLPMKPIVRHAMKKIAVDDEHYESKCYIPGIIPFFAAVIITMVYHAY